VRVVLDGSALPVYAGALAAAERGIRTGGDARNRRYLDGHVDVAVGEAVEALAYDPQTSGGLLAAVEPAVVADLTGVGFVPVGEVAAADPEPRVTLA
jgi:selenide,water dikinase